MSRLALLALLLPFGIGGPALPAPAVEGIVPNENTRAAGALNGKLLTVALEARMGQWRPEGPSGRAVDVAAFSEVGKPLQTPGPLIRVTVGTEVRATIRNGLDKPLKVFGFGKTRGMSDSVTIAPKAVRPVSFTATTPGTFYYTANRGLDPVIGRVSEDLQLSGVIVVDPAGAKPPAGERIFAISWYYTINTRSKTGLGRGSMAINGLAWPHSEKLAYTQGDSVHWRVVNFTEADHPMHLHGFYFRVDARGDGIADTAYSADQKRMGVTEVVNPFTTMSLAWKPTRPGNWVYHCHYAGHISHLAELDTKDGDLDHAAMSQHASDRPHQMFGLVMGISVAPRGDVPASYAGARAIRIVQRMKPNVYGKQPGMSFVVDGTPEAKDPNALSIPGPTLVLERDKPVAVTIVNQSSEHATIHWHGIELESYPDGVPGWSGSGRNILPSIKPHDSLTVRWTPPRAGSFMYHAHFNEAQQMGSGLYGPIIVVEPGQKFDPAVDKVMFFGTAGMNVNPILGPFPDLLLNGQLRPPPMELKKGTKYRFRFFNLAGDIPTMVSINEQKAPVSWNPVAKDGYPLPASQSKARPAVLVFDPGEIYDFEYTPTAGDLTLTFGIPPFPPPPPPPPGVTPLPIPKLPATVTVQLRVK